MSPQSLPSDRPLAGLGRALAALRKQRGWSRGELARAAGVAPETVGRCERDRGQPSARVLEVLLAALGAHLGDLFEAQVAAWNDTRTGWPAGRPDSGSGGVPSRIAWLEVRARVGRLQQQLERLQEAVYGEKVAQAGRLAHSLQESSLPDEQRGQLDRELAGAAERLRELHNLLQVEPSAALDLHAEYSSGEGAKEGEAGAPLKR